jgi:vanillate O-demethylase ferredoxin subunit
MNGVEAMNDNADTLRVAIVRRKMEADGIVSLELRALADKSLPPFDAGSHVDVIVAPDLVRQYSLCNDPAESGRYRIAILLEPNSRGGSAEIHRAFDENRTIEISRPRNNFPLIETAEKTFLLAGGIGVTPLLAMAYRLHALERDFELHYCARTRTKAAFTAELAAVPFAARIHLHFDDEGPQQALDLDRLGGAADAHVYICGPQGFIEHASAGVRQHGFSDDRIHVEYFSAEVSSAGSFFTIFAARTGKLIDVPEGRTIAEALGEAGIDVLLSCREGVCGTCLTGVLEGTPDHRDFVQTADEKASNRQIAVCCSRALSTKLVLDI